MTQSMRAIHQHCSDNLAKTYNSDTQIETVAIFATDNVLDVVWRTGEQPLGND